MAIDKIVIVDHSLYEDHFTLKLAGNDIDYDSIYARDNSGRVFLPSECYTQEVIVTFPYENEGLTIYISDTYGHTLNATLSAYEK